MRYLFLAAIALLVLPPSIAAAAPSWAPATATSVEAGGNGHSTFVIQAYLTLPTQCHAARIRTATLSMSGHRSFVVEQMASSSPCSQAQYKCTVVGTFNLPVTAKFEVDSKDKKWEVHLAADRPTPVQPMCRKG
jgi:hypothetical protein